MRFVMLWNQPPPPTNARLVLSVPNPVCFSDSVDHYGFVGEEYNAVDGESMVGKDDRHPRGTDGPNVLIMGCGSDVPMWTTLVEFLGGKVVFVDGADLSPPSPRPSLPLDVPGRS